MTKKERRILDARILRYLSTEAMEELDGDRDGWRDLNDVFFVVHNQKKSDFDGSKFWITSEKIRRRLLALSKKWPKVKRRVIGWEETVNGTYSGLKRKTAEYKWEAK